MPKSKSEILANLQKHAEVIAATYKKPCTVRFSARFRASASQNIGGQYILSHVDVVFDGISKRHHYPLPILCWNGLYTCHVDEPTREM